MIRKILDWLIQRILTLVSENGHYAVAGTTSSTRLCTRTVTPLDIDGGPRELLVECDAHGELGRLPYGRNEVGRMFALWDRHIEEIRRTRR